MSRTSDEESSTQTNNGTLTISVSPTPTPSKYPISLTISPALPSDAPTLSAIEMLTFIDDPTSAHIYPLRRGLVDAGKNDPREWPDYGLVVMRRWMGIRNGVVSLKVTMRGNGGGEEIVGFESMTPPERLLRPIEDVGDISGLVIPSAQNSSSDAQDVQKVGRIEHGIDTIFFDEFRDEVSRVRAEIMGEREYFALSHFFTSPTHHRLGIGSTLMFRCIQIANEANLPILLESTRVGVAFYEQHGFETVRRCKLEYNGGVVGWPG